MLIPFALVCSCQKARVSTVEQQFAQRKADLDAREKALDEREKALALREKLAASRGFLRLPESLPPNLSEPFPLNSRASFQIRLTGRDHRQ
jgi:hypothetical protein